MRLPRTLTCLIAVTTFTGVTALSGCGSDDADPPAVATPATAASEAGSPGGSTDETEAASGGLIDICEQLTAAEVSDLLGGPVTSEDVPGGGCNYSNEDDPRAASMQVTGSVIDEGAGGFDGSVAGVDGVLGGDAGETLDGVGEQAYLKTGTFGGSDYVRGSGLVRVGATLAQVDLSPDQGTSAKNVRAILVKALTLVASKG